MFKDIDFKKKIKTEKIKDTLKFISDYDLATVDGDSHMTEFMYKNKSKIFTKSLSRKMKTITIEIDYKYFCDYWKCSQSRRLEGRYRDMLVSYFMNNICRDDFLEDVIVKHTKKRNILFLNFNFCDYGLDDDIDYNEYVPHGCVLILLPHKGRYHAYYINSHGKDLLLYDTYGYKISKKKKREIKYDVPVDVMFIDTYLNFLRKNYEIDVVYNSTDKHNYYGCDLQSGDNHGICFIFPYIIWYFFGKYYNKERHYFFKGKKITLKSTRKMLLGGNLTECIESFILGFNEKYDTLFLKGQLDKSYNREKYTKKLDKVIEKSGTIFVKKILGVFIPFFSQGLKK